MGIGHWFHHATDQGHDDGPLKVVFLMGKTGVGKSTFINLLGGKNMETGLPPVVGHGSYSCTLKWDAFGVELDGKHIFLIDTPGFDDAGDNDQKNLHNILCCLHLINCISPKVELHGVIFLHDISETRFSGSQQMTYSLCQKLCGPEAMKSVVFGSTKWCMTNQEEHDHQREREREILQGFCSDISYAYRLPGGDSNAAIKAVKQLLDGQPITLLAQTEVKGCEPNDLPDIESTTVGDYLLHKASAPEKVWDSHKRGRFFGVRRIFHPTTDITLFTSVPKALMGFPAQAVIALIRLFKLLRK